MSKDLARADRKEVMGFTGKNLEAADYLLQEAALDESRGRQLRRSGEAILASFLRLNMSPPVAEGFNLDDGRPVRAIHRGDEHPPVICWFPEWWSPTGQGLVIIPAPNQISDLLPGLNPEPFNLNPEP